MNAEEGMNFKEACDLQLGFIFQLILGLLKIHSSQSNPQQAVLTIPSQLKPLSVNTSGGVQTILMPVNKGEFFTCGCGGLWVCLVGKSVFRHLVAVPPSFSLPLSCHHTPWHHL